MSLRSFKGLVGFAFLSLFFFSCTKEKSVELNMPTMPTSGGTAVYALSVAGTGGTCMNADVQGTYKAGVATAVGTNKVSVEVSVNTIGTWTVSSAAITGFYFDGSGSFANTGTQNITLNAHGTPTTAGTQTFTLIVGGVSCTFDVIVDSASTGGGGGGGNPPPAGSDYYPRTTNSHWTYMYDNDPTDTSRVFVIAPTKTLAGNVYNIFMYDDGSTVDTSGYFRKSGGDYHSWDNMQDVVGFDNPVYVDEIMLKDDVAASTTWNSNEFSGTLGGQPLTMRLKATVLQKDVSVTVNSTAYPNTIVMKLELESKVLGQWVSLTSSAGYSKQYYSRNIGMIKWEFYDGSGSVATTMDLMNYHVF